MGRGRAPCCDKSKVRAGPWSPAEDLRLINFIQKHGHSNWRALPKQAGLLRCGKSCRLRWINYLRPDVKRGNFTPEEEQTIINLHNTLGNKWSKIASYLPGRTDNEIKNVWNTHLKKRLTEGKVDDGNGETAKDDPKRAVASCSASQSCTSCISITTSEDDNTDTTTTTTLLCGIGGGVQMKPETPMEDRIEPKGLTASSVYHSTASSPPPPSSSSSYFSSCMQLDNNNLQLLEASELSESCRPTNDNNNINSSHPSEGCLDDGRIIELPTTFEPDPDFWKLLDSVDPLLDHDPNKGENHLQDAKCDEEVELSKWLNFLENELAAGGADRMHIPDDQGKRDYQVGAPEIIQPSSEYYFPLWPLSPLNLDL